MISADFSMSVPTLSEMGRHFRESCQAWVINKAPVIVGNDKQIFVKKLKVSEISINHINDVCFDCNFNHYLLCFSVVDIWTLRDYLNMVFSNFE